MTRALHQFVPNLAAGDAIGVHVRLTQAALRAAGWESEIFYDEVHPSMRKLGRHYSTFDRAVDGRDGDAWIFFQLSTGSRLTSFALDQDLPLGVLYFNVTPPVFFDRWEPAAADNLRAALTDVRRLAASSRFAIGNSTFSEHELVAAGYSPTAVCPVLFDLKELDVPANDRLMQRLRRQTQEGGSRWLFIGRVAPNKCQHDLIASFAAYRELYDDNARLTIVGGRTSNVYFRSLELLVEELGVADAVEFTDVVSHEEKLACYRASDVFVCLSEHEGFMVPVVEAMHLGVPVVAYAATAVTETVGSAGVLLADKDPVLVATAVHRVLGDADLKAQLTEEGRARAQSFSLERSSRTLLDALNRFVP